MALDLTQAGAAYKTLVRILLDTVTLRYAFDDTTLDDGTIYDGKLISITPLNLATGDILDPRVALPFMELVLSNHDDAVRQATDDHQWATRAVELDLGHGLDAADFETIFKGTVHFPGSISYWDDRELRVQVDDARSKDAKVLPTSRFDIDTYPNIDPSALYQPVPILYGDFRSTAGGGEKVPAYQIDDTEGTGGRWKISSVALAGIQAVYKNDISVAFTASSGDLDSGEFVLDVAYTQGTDVVTVHCEGATDDGTSSGTRLDTLPDIFDDILQTHLGVSAANIDATAIAAWNNALSLTKDLARRWIGTEISSDDLIRDLLIDGFADHNMSDGKYTPVYRIFDVSAGLTTYNKVDIKSDGDGRKLFSVSRDPERTYANEIVADYRLDPVAGSHAVTFSDQKADAIASAGTTKRRRLTLNWMYVQDGVESRVKRELVVFSVEVEQVNVTLDSAAMQLEPTDTFLLDYSKFNGAAIQVRNITIDFQSMQARVSGWNVNRMIPGRWTSASAPAWGAATNAEREAQGFWCDAAGRADPADADSERSVWY